MKNTRRINEKGVSIGIAGSRMAMRQHCHMDEKNLAAQHRQTRFFAHNMLCIPSRYNQVKVRMVDAAESSRISIIDSSGARMGGALDLTAPAGGRKEGETIWGHTGRYTTSLSPVISKRKHKQIQHDSKISIFNLHEFSQRTAVRVGRIRGDIKFL
jgi:hypothetical protein